MLPLAASWCPRLSKKEKTCWTLISLAALGALVYEWILVIQCYVDQPVRSNVFYKEPKRMRFPSLLFCQRQFYLNETQIGGNLNDQPSQNVARYMRIVTNPTGSDVSANGAQSNGLVFSSEQDQSKAQADYLAYVAKYHNNPWAAFERVMLSCPDTVKQCALGGQNYSSATCCQQWAVRRLTPVGPCLAMQPPDQELPSSNGAFEIDFELAPSAYNFAANFGGFDLYVGDTIGKPMSAALTLSDEDSYTVQLAATTYENSIDRECNRRLGPLFRQLDFAGMDQAMRCTASIIYKLCQCNPVYKVQFDGVASTYNAPYSYGMDSGSSFQVSQGSYQFCDLTNILRCAAPLLNATRDQSNFTAVAQRQLGYVPCDMRPPCVDNRYHFAVTEFREMTPVSSGYRSRLRLYYESFVLTEIEQRQSYSFHDVVVNMGGALTFWFIIVHLLIYFMSACKSCFDYGGHQKQVNGLGRNKVVDIEVAPRPDAQCPKPMPPVLQPVEPIVDMVDETK